MSRWQTNQPEECENIEILGINQKDRCYSEYSIATNDPEYCPDNYFGCEFKLSSQEEQENMIQELISETDPKELNSELLNSAINYEDTLFCEYLAGTTTSSLPEVDYEEYCLISMVYYLENEEYCELISTESIKNKCEKILECKETPMHLFECMEN